jgi:hypothetical protein
MVPTLLVIIIPLLGSLFAGCADTHSHNVYLSPDAQVRRYVETEDLSRLPNRRLAITSFGIEYDTKLLFPLADGHHYRHPSGIPAVLHFHKEITLDLTRERMQSLVDQAYTQLVLDLQAAGYDIIPYNAYNELPVYRLLINFGGYDSPTSFTFKLGDPENPALGEALVLAPTGLRWYSSALGEVGSRLVKTLTSVDSDIRLTGRGLLGEESIGQAEINLANTLNATLVKAYYVASPVRNVTEHELLAGALPVEGSTIVGHGETRLAFRTPDASTGHHSFEKNTPPRDGNAFVRLQRDVTIDDDLRSGQTLKTHLDVISKLFILAMMAER